MNRSSSSILVVDDDRDVLTSAGILLKQFYTSVQTIESPSKLPDLLSGQKWDVVLLDMNFSRGINNGSEGIKWLKFIREGDPDCAVIMITAFGCIDIAVEAIKLGAHDFILKPWQNEKFISTVRSAAEIAKARTGLRLMREYEERQFSDFSKDMTELDFPSSSMQRVIENIRRIAPTDADILIKGENGTGKEYLARQIHSLSGRSVSRFVTLDPGSIPETLFESELFGHVRGAFTDARVERTGRMEMASGGTLFLDEIANIPLKAQSSLLSSLERRIVTKIGSNVETKVDIRLISSTNRDVRLLVNRNLFREDLLYRINLFEIDIPPLRERVDDIPVLVNHFFRIYSKKYNRSDIIIPKATMSLLKKYRWPGNIRELDHSVERALIMCEKRQLDYSDFRLGYNDNSLLYREEELNIENIEKQTVIKALTKNNGNISRAAKDLGITRTSLYRRIEKYGI